MDGREAVGVAGAAGTVRRERRCGAAVDGCRLRDEMVVEAARSALTVGNVTT